MIQKPNISHQRRCETCSACCYVFSVPDLRENMEPCKHLVTPRGELPLHPWERGGTCGIYEKQRPFECVGFACEYLLGNIPSYTQDTDGNLYLTRPDRSGIIFERALFTAREVWPGAFDSQSGKALLKITNDGRPFRGCLEFYAMVPCEKKD